MGGKHHRQDRTQRSARPVYAERVRRIIIPEFALNPRHHQLANHAGNGADGQGGHGSHKTGGGSDGHQAGHRAGNGA